MQIEVMNVNDVAPVFDQPGYELRLREGYISPDPIIKVSVSDQTQMLDNMPETETIRL